MFWGRIIRILIKCVKIEILTLTPPQRGGVGPMDSIFVSDFAHGIWCRDRTQERCVLVDGGLS